MTRANIGLRASWLALALCGTLALTARAQTSTDEDNWDNQLFVGTRVAYAKDRWRFSGEFQSRFKEDVRELDNWFVEAVATFLPSEHWEVVPDFRLSIKPSRIEYRPGLGLLFKLTPRDWQLVHQVKYQADIASTGDVGHGFRQAVFVNHILGRFVPNIGGGWFYRWSEEFTGMEFVRFGAGLTVVFDPLHTLTLSYYFGAANTGERWTWSGIPLVQLTLNVRTDWKYVPAKLVNF